MDDIYFKTRKKLFEQIINLLFQDNVPIKSMISSVLKHIQEDIQHLKFKFEAQESSLNDSLLKISQTVSIVEDVKHRNNILTNPNQLQKRKKQPKKHKTTVPSLLAFFEATQRDSCLQYDRNFLKLIGSQCKSREDLRDRLYEEISSRNGYIRSSLRGWVFYAKKYKKSTKARSVDFCSTKARDLINSSVNQSYQGNIDCQVILPYANTEEIDKADQLNISKIVKSSRSNKASSSLFPSINPKGSRNSSMPSHSVNMKMTRSSEPNSIILGKIVDSRSSQGSLQVVEYMTSINQGNFKYGQFSPDRKYIPIKKFDPCKLNIPEGIDQILKIGRIQEKPKKKTILFNFNFVNQNRKVVSIIPMLNQGSKLVTILQNRLQDEIKKTCISIKN